MPSQSKIKNRQSKILLLGLLLAAMPPLDASPHLSGDNRIFGVKMQYEPHNIAPGYCAQAINLRFTKGVPETRKGPVFLPWMNKIVSGQMQPWGNVYGVGTFRDPATEREYILVAADGAIYYTAPGNVATALTLPGATTITAPCRFVQCFDAVLCLRGPDFPVLRLRYIYAGFEEVAQTDQGDGTLTIPSSSFGLCAQNRLFLVDGDNVLASDDSDYTRYTLFDELRINAGSEDSLLAIGLFGRSTIVALKSASVHRVDGLYGNLANMTLSEVTRRYGCVAAESALDLGTDFVWLSHEGVASLTLTQQNELQAAQGVQTGGWPMFSDDIKPLISRINWNYASGATAAFSDGKYYLAVPLDDAEVLGFELAYLCRYSLGDFVTGQIILPGLTAGKKYRYLPDPSGGGQPGTERSLVNGTQTLTGAGDFIAQGASVTLNGQSQAYMLGSVRQVTSGVNNAVLVFDTQAGPGGAWAGHDEGEEIKVKRFFTATYLNRRRLFFMSAEGFIKLYEEDYQDQRSFPCVDVLVQSTPLIGSVLQVNGGTRLTANNGAVNNAAGSWGCFDMAQAVLDLWSDFENHGGFAASASSPWSAPNTAKILHVTAGVADGIRFYGTNGLMPTVQAGGWAKIITTATSPVVATFLSRGYAQGDMSQERFRFLALDIQTWNPSFTVEILTEGINETRAVSRMGLTTFTKSRKKFDRPFDEPAFDEQNPDGRFNQRYRQDYALVPTGPSFSFKPSAGVRGDLHQDSHELFPIRAEARAPQVRIINSQGRIRILSLRLQSQAAPDRPDSFTPAAAVAAATVVTSSALGDSQGLVGDSQGPLAG